MRLLWYLITHTELVLRIVEGKIRLLTGLFLLFLEDIAGLHSATVGLGLNEINETGCAWVVLNWQMKIIRRPAYNDELTVYTWSTSADKLFAERDFRITDKNGETIVIATSRWLYMDINRRRPVRITPRNNGQI